MITAVDIRTVYVFGALLGLLLIGLMSFVYLKLATYAGFRWWLASIGCYAGGLAIYWINNYHSNRFIIGLGNYFFLSNTVLALVGTSRFVGRPVNRWLIGIPVVFGVVTTAYFTWGVDARVLRICCSSGALVFIAAVHLRLIRSARFESSIGRAASCLIFFAAIFIGWMVTRMVFIVGFEASSSEGLNNLFQAVTYAVVCSCNVGFVFSFLGLTFARTEERLLQLVQNHSELKRSIDAGAIVAVTDRAGAILEVNERFCAISKFSRAELVGRNHRVLNSGTHSPAFFAQLWARILAGEAWQGEICNRAKDGALYWVSATIVPIRALDGQVERFIAITADITARKQAETALRDSEARYRLLVEASPESFIVHRDGIVIYANPAAVRMFGAASDQDLIGQPMLDLIHPDFHELVRQRRKNVAELGSGGPPAEMRYVRLDGTVFEVESQSRAVMFDGVRVTQVAAHDISERKRSAAARQEFDRKLQETQKLESLGVLAGGIAHDFNNILAAILGNASLASLDLPPGSPVEDNLKAITEGSQRAADLCKQMLAYSGKGNFVVRNFNLNRLVEETAHLLKISISKNAVLRFNLQADLPAILADATQIRQVIMNLVINASEAIGTGSGVISLTTGVVAVNGVYLSGSGAIVAQEMPDGDYVFLEVADSGCGMSPETQARIFDPFYTTKFAGRGLGLAAVLGIVRGHKGALKLSSAPGQGTTFKLLLPCVAGVAESAAAAPAPKPAWRGRGCVLVVDDEDAVRRMGEAMLQKLGFAVVLAGDGATALEIFRGEPDRFALVLMDLTMPRLNGREAFAELRRIRPEIPVVLMSGFNEQEAHLPSGEKGRTSFVQKPFLHDELSRVVQGVLAAGPPAA